MIKFFYDHIETITLLALIFIPLALFGAIVLIGSGSTLEASQLEGFPKRKESE